MISSFLISIKKSYLEEKLNKFREQKFVDSGIVKTCDEIDLKVFVPIRQVLRPQPHRFL